MTLDNHHAQALRKENRNNKIWNYILIGGVVFAIGSIALVFGMFIWGMSMLSDSLNKEWDAQAEIDFIDQAHYQGYTDSQMYEKHCFAKPTGEEGNTWSYFGACSVTGHWVKLGNGLVEWHNDLTLNVRSFN